MITMRTVLKNHAIWLAARFAARLKYRAQMQYTSLDTPRSIAERQLDKLLDTIQDRQDQQK